MSPAHNPKRPGERSGEVVSWHLPDPGIGERERWLRVSDSRSTLLSVPPSLLAL